MILTNSEEAEAWALRSIIASVQVIRGYDFGTKILVAGKTDAERTARIAPGSPLGELALGLHHVAMMLRGGDPHAPRPHIERAIAGLARDALTRYAENAYYGWSLRIDDANRSCQEWLAAEPTAGFPRWVLSWHAFTGRHAAEAERWAMEGAKYSDGVTELRSHFTLFEVNFFLRADLAAARAALERVPGAAQLNHRIVYGRWFLALAERKEDEAIRDLARVPDTILYEKSFHGPKALLAGIAHVKAGRSAPAAAQFAEAERVLRELLASDADNEQLRAALALTLAYVGRAADARSELAAIEPLLRGRPPYVYSGHVQAQIAETHAVLHDVAGMLPWLRLLFGVPSSVPYTPASFRLDPRFESVAKDPRVEALLAEFSARELAKPASAVAASGFNQKSVAVLAFANQSGDKDNEYFSDGIADELLTVLQKIPGLRVAARTSAFSFKGKGATAQEVGEKLGMAHVVEGSVQKSGKRVKITARLSRAATNEELWSKSFEPLELTDVFATQSEIAQAIVGELRGRLTGDAATVAKAEIVAQVQAAAKGGTKNSDAHQLYLHGRFFLNQGSRTGYARAIEMFQQATRLDQNFALGWARLAFTQALFAGEGFATSYETGYSAARQAAQRALTIEPDLAEGHVALAIVRVMFDWDWAGARSSSERALALAPSAAEVASPVVWLASALGQEERAIAAGQRGVELDPLNFKVRTDLALAYWIFERFEDCKTEARRAIELSPAGAWGYFTLVLGCLSTGALDEAETASASLTDASYRLVSAALLRQAQGRKAEADTAVGELEKNHPTEIAYQLGEIYALRGDRDRAFLWLENAFTQRDPGMVFLRRDPLLKSLHADLRWPALLRKMGLHDDQLK